MAKVYTPNSDIIEPFAIPESSEAVGRGLDYGNFMHLNGAEHAVIETQRRLAVLQEALPDERHWIMEATRDLRRKQQKLRHVERDIAEGIKIY